MTIKTDPFAICCISPQLVQSGNIAILEELFKARVGVEQGQDPVTVGPEVGRPVIDLGRGVLDLIKFSSQEIYVVPFRTALFIILDKCSMAFAELANAVEFILPVLFEGFAAGIGIEVVAEEEEIVLEEAGESWFEMLEKIDLDGIVTETGLANFLLGALPVVGGDLVALLGQGSAGRMVTGTGRGVTDPGDGLLHFFLQA